jgi:hypothetical protein
MRYLMLIYGDEAVSAAMSETEQAANMGAWMSYTEDFQKTGKMVAGEALMPTATATSIRRGAGDARLTTDGPFVETKEALGGFYMIDAASLEEAVTWAGKMPIIARGGCVEIREIVEYN